MRRAWFAIFIGVLAACGAQRVDAPSPLAGDAATTRDSVVAEQSEVGDPSLSDLALVKVASIDQPVDAASRVGDAAVYFVSRSGTIHRFMDGAFEATPVLDISDLTDGDGERGLLGLAFSLTGDIAYVNYTDAKVTPRSPRSRWMVLGNLIATRCAPCSALSSRSAITTLVMS